MPGLVPGIHVFAAGFTDVDGRDKPRNDGKRGLSHGFHRAVLKASAKSDPVDQERKISGKNEQKYKKVEFSQS